MNDDDKWMSTNGVYKAANQFIESDAKCVIDAKCDQIHK